MKHYLSIFVVAALLPFACPLSAQTTMRIGAVQHTNGKVVTPGFWLANSNEINAVVPVPALPSWISTNPAISLSNLTTTNYVTTLGLHVPSFSATNARLAYWSLSGNVSQAGVGVNTNVTPDLQASIGLGTNNAVRFAEVSVGEFTISGSGTGSFGGDDIFELRTNGLYISQPALTISSLGLSPTDTVTFGGVAAGVVTNVVGSGDIAAANEVSGLRGTFGELNLGNNGFALAEDEFGRMTLTGDLYFLSASNAAVFRANAGLPWSGLTNTNAAGFHNALNLSSWTTNPTSPLFSLPPEAVQYEGDSIKVADSAELGQAGVILAPYFVGAWAAGTTNAWISGSYTPGQPVTVNGPLALSSPSYRGPTLSNLEIGYLGTNAATTISNLFASNSLALNSGTITSNAPALSVSQTWSNATNAFTAFRVNVTNLASTNSFLADFQNSNVSRLAIRPDGTLVNNAPANHTALTTTLNFISMDIAAPGGGRIRLSGSGLGSQPVRLFASGGYAFNTTANDASISGFILFAEAPHTMALRDGTNSQTNNIYGSFTNSTNYRRLSIGMSNSGVAFIRPESAGPLATTNVLNISGIGTTATNGTVWSDGGLLKDTNVVGIPSGNAPLGAIPVADAAGGSAWVASRVVRRVLTNDVTRTSWTTNGPQQVGSVETNFGTWTLDANSTYKVEYVVRTSYAVTNAAFLHAFNFSTNLVTYTNAAIGVSLIPTLTPTQIAHSSSALFVQPVGTATGTRIGTGYLVFVTDSNAVTLTYGWCPASNTTNPLTLHAGSLITVEKVSP